MKASGEEPLFSKDEILSGHIGRRPARLLSLIEMHCAHMRAESRRAIEAYFLSDHQEFTRQFDLDYFQSFRLRARRTPKLTLDDLERYAGQWSALVPDDPALRAGMIHLLARRYPLADKAIPQIRAALGFAERAVQDAYQQIYGEPLETVLSAVPVPREEEPEAAESADESALRDAEASLEWLNLPSNSVLYREGEVGDSLYILINGRLRAVVTQEDGSERVVAELGRGEIVGEMEVLTGERRSTTVYAIRDSELVKLAGAAFNRLAEKYPQVMMRVNRIIANRLRLSLTDVRRARNTLMTFAIVPVSAETPLAEFTRRLAQVFAGYGPTLHLNSARLDGELGAGAAQTRPGDADNGRVAAWLSEQESQYRYILYEADAGLSPWTGRCIRQADRILILAEAQADPKPGEIEKHIESMNAASHAELVLLHPASTMRPAGTHNWLAPRRVQGHYHVRENNDEDLQRLARRLTGRALGLVLSGGAARGYAHIGVWRALQEAGFQIDLIGGTSMGALLGAMLAMGLEEQGRVDEILQRFASARKIMDLTLPLVSLLASRKVTQILRGIFSDAQIEDLWRPFFCVSTNLTRAEPVVHRQGPLWQAVRASIAIPAVFSPILHEGDVLVDGGVLNNLPIDVMAQEFSQGGPIVAVDINPDHDLDKEYNFGPSISGWQVLMGKLNPFAGKVTAPSISESILRTMTVNDVQRAKAKRALADLYIHPHVGHFGLFDWDRYDEIIAIGYRTAKQAIEEWKCNPGGSRLAECLPPTASS